MQCTVECITWFMPPISQHIGKLMCKLITSPKLSRNSTLLTLSHFIFPSLGLNGFHFHSLGLRSLRILDHNWNQISNHLSFRCGKIKYHPGNNWLGQSTYYYISASSSRKSQLNSVFSVTQLCKRKLTNFLFLPTLPSTPKIIKTTMKETMYVCTYLFYNVRNHHTKIEMGIRCKFLIFTRFHFYITSIVNSYQSKS
jgi:hypothetical protein